MTDVEASTTCHFDTDGCICHAAGYCPVLKMEVSEKKIYQCRSNEYFRSRFREVASRTLEHKIHLGNTESNFQLPRNSVRSPVKTVCANLGTKLTEEPCSCGSQRKINVYSCNELKNERGKPIKCVKTLHDLSSIKDKNLARIIVACEQCKHHSKRKKSISQRFSARRSSLASTFRTEGNPRFISLEQFSRDIQHFIGLLPPNVTSVAGVSRSGLNPATMVAMMLHVPLQIVRHKKGDVVSAGNGWRLDEGAPLSNGQGLTLVLDDTTMTGNSLKLSRHISQQIPGKKIFASIYCNPATKTKPDLWAVDLPWPHILEWNLFNSILTPASAVDFDGILCHDCTPHQDDDGEHYLDFLQNARPKYLVRKKPIPLIVTARLEKYRPQTEAWLRKWGIQWQQLIMGPWHNLSERRRSDISAYKAEHYRTFMQRIVRPGPHLFIESDAHQAVRIAQLSGGITVCPAAGRCFQ